MQHIRFYSLSVFDLVIVLSIILCFTYLQRQKALPQISTVRDLVDMLNTRGGNIAILGLMSMIFFRTGVQMFYWVIDKTHDGVLKSTDAFVVMGVTWITASCFGGAFTTMVKAMTGEVTAPPTAPVVK